MKIYKQKIKREKYNIKNNENVSLVLKTKINFNRKSINHTNII